MSARLRAINTHLPQLETTIEGLVAPISKDCLTKKIITKQVYLSLIHSKKSKGEKAKDLIHHVWKAIRQDDSKCEQFLQILEKHKSCLELVANIRQDQAEIAGVAQAAHNIEGNLVTLRRSRSQGSHLHPVQCMQASTETPPNAGSFMNSEVYDRYNEQQEKAQQEAKLSSAQEENKKLQAQQKALQKKRDKIKQEKRALENEVVSKEQEMERLRTERDNLKDSKDILKNKLARLEKKSHVDTKKVKNAVTRYEERIKTLEAEKASLNETLEDMDKEYQCVQKRLNQLSGVAKQYEATIRELKNELAQHAKATESGHRICIKYLTIRIHHPKECKIACLILCLILALAIVLLFYFLIWQ